MRSRVELVVDRVAVAVASFVAGPWAAAAAACSASARGLARLGLQRRRQPLPRRPLVVAAAGLAAGCALPRLVSGTWWPGPWPACCWWSFSLAALACWTVWARHGAGRRAAAALVMAIGGAGAAWSTARLDLFPSADIAWQLSESPSPLAVTATLVESFRRLPAAPPSRSAANAETSVGVVAVDAIRDGSRWRPATGRAAVVVEGTAPDVRPGSRLRIFGRGLRPGTALNPGEPDFRLKARDDRRLSVIRVRGAASMRAIQDGGGWSPLAAVEWVRRRGAEALRSHLSPARAPLAAALLLGDRGGLRGAEAEAFLVTGTVHVLSISGLHVGLLAIALLAILRTVGVPRPAVACLVVTVIGCYAVLVRCETPVLRATILVWIACLARAFSRRPSLAGGLAAATVVVLVWRPGDVVAPGALLSFLSTAVLVGAGSMVSRPGLPEDPIDRLIARSRHPIERGLRSFGRRAWLAFAIGAAVWLATAPLVVSRFHVVSPIGLVVNVVIAPLVAVAMVAGFLCLASAAWSTPAATACGTVCDAALDALTSLVVWSSRVPGGHAWLPGPPDWWVVGWYAGFAAALLLLDAGCLRRGWTWGVLATGWLAVWGVVDAGGRCLAPATRPLRVIVAALGHGCGVIVRSPSGRCLLYDAGRMAAPGPARRAVAGVLWSEGLVRIDALVISHPDADHYNAVPGLLDRFTVGEIVVSERFMSAGSPGVRDLRRRAAGLGIPIRVARAGESFALDPLCRVRVLHPGADVPSSDDNAASLVVTVEACGRRLLLTGDLDGRALQAFAASSPGECDVLVAPHHGSRTSLPADIAAATTPGVVLVSGAAGRGWPEVRAAYAAAARDTPTPLVLKTGTEGAISVDLSAASVATARYSRGGWRDVEPE